LIQGLLGKTRPIASIAASFALIPKNVHPSSDACRKELTIENIWSGCAAFASCAGLQIQSSNSTIRRRTPMTTIVAVRGLFSAAEKINEASRSLCCDHCRRELRFPVHRYWRMRFCSAACANAYQQRLSPRTQQKIYEIDGYRPSWKAAS